CVKIEMQIERDTVIEPDALIINRVTTDQAKTERDDFTALSPDEETRTFRHPLRDAEEIVLCQRFKFYWRPLVDREVKRIDFVNERAEVACGLHLDLRSALGFPKFSSKFFPGRLAQRAKIFIPVLITERQPRHWHAGNPGITI